MRMDCRSPWAAASTSLPSTRREVLARNGDLCVVPGCIAKGHHLEIHHVIHREDGGGHDTWNLACVCPRHHRHHRGLLDITGNADEPEGVGVQQRQEPPNSRRTHHHTAQRPATAMDPPLPAPHRRTPRHLRDRLQPTPATATGGSVTYADGRRSGRARCRVRPRARGSERRDLVHVTLSRRVLSTCGAMQPRHPSEPTPVSGIRMSVGSC
jgi:hypothetical protein